MSTPLLTQTPKKKTKVYTIDQAIQFLNDHFAGYGRKKQFCDTHKQIKYSTLNSIINHKPNAKTKTPLAFKQITVIFKALGYDCKLVKTIEFHISE